MSLVTVGHYLNPIEAHIVRGRIEAEGIQAYIQHEHHIWADWTLSQLLGYVKVQVSSGDVDASLGIIGKLRAGEFALLSGEVPETICPKCGSSKTDEVNWLWKLALLGSLLFSILLPYTIYRVKCADCKYSWTQKELRGQSLWAIAFVTLLIAVGLIIFGETFYYVCKINFWSEVCI